MYVDTMASQWRIVTSVTAPLREESGEPRELVLAFKIGRDQENGSIWNARSTLERTYAGPEFSSFK
jgi:hypothetical protein